MADAHETFALLASQREMGWPCRVQHPQLRSARTFRVNSRFEKYLRYAAYFNGDVNGNVWVTIDIMGEIEIREFLDAFGRSVFARWFEELNAAAAARVTVALTRLGRGNFSNVESVGSGVYELKIDFGPGYRVYFGKDGERIVILLGGSTKKRQSDAIAAAQSTWTVYKRRKGGKE